jgi:hypothetical protein
VTAHHLNLAAPQPRIGASPRFISVSLHLKLSAGHLQSVSRACTVRHRSQRAQPVNLWIVSYLETSSCAGAMGRRDLQYKPDAAPEKYLNTRSVQILLASSAAAGPLRDLVACSEAC